ncbi:MAG TPA: lysine-sensitive aspartokinase 3 [Pyrinomonadaceae bacterium]|nr:lysine-sensitive aspartokinase 3 [Pyrinomonadaceae bacterium]
MRINPTILKFGGTSVEDANAFRNVAKIVLAAAEANPVIVVSAISGFTNSLLKSVDRAFGGDPRNASRSLEPDFARHVAIAGELLNADAGATFEQALAAARGEIRQLHRIIAAHPVTTPPLQDEIVAYGEQLSSQLLAAVLREHGLAARQIDARRCIKTDESYGTASPLPESEQSTRNEVLPLLESSKIPVLGGFIGSTISGVTTTLGRGGSDYTAALVGAALVAREIQIWTDVSGVLTADPRVVPEAKTIPVLSYQEAAELAYFGAKVLHPKTIQPAIDKDIPVRVCNSRAANDAGTRIVPESEAAPQTIKAIAHKSGITTVQVTSARMLGAYGFLRRLFEVFDQHQTAVDVVTTSEVSVSLSIDDASTLTELVLDLEELGTVEVEKDRTIISVVGEGLRNTPGIAAKVFSVISDINVSMISVGASSVNLTFMVDAEHAAEAITRLHRVCFEQSTDTAAKAAVPTGALPDVRATAPISPTVRRSSRG